MKLPVDELNDLISQLRRQAEVDTAALNRYKALCDELFDQLDNNVQAAIDVEAMKAAKARYREERK